MDKKKQDLALPATPPTGDETNDTAPSALNLGLQEPRPRRHRSVRRKILQALRIAEPFALVLGLGLLSAGVIEVVETQVPTRGDQLDSARLARASIAQPNPTQTFEVATYTSQRTETDAVARDETTYSTTSINSTSNTSAEPPGIVGEGLESP